MPKPRQKVTDEDVFAAAQRVMGRRGPHELTLADIAGEAGLTPGRLVQRFGSKRALLLALSERFAGSAGAVFAALRAEHGSPLATVRAYATCMADLAPTPDALLRNLAYLQGDLADEALRGHLVENARAALRELEVLLRAAIASRELDRGTDVGVLARTLEVVISGSLMAWATYQEGAAADWIARDVEAVLSPYLTKRARSTGGAAAPRGSEPRAAARAGNTRHRR
jgi:AcrR family transcriptional regulator